MSIVTALHLRQLAGWFQDERPVSLERSWRSDNVREQEIFWGTRTVCDISLAEFTTARSYQDDINQRVHAHVASSKAVLQTRRLSRHGPRALSFCVIP